MTEQCRAAANLKGEHISCDNGPDHTGWPHSNTEHELIWQSDAEAKPEPPPDASWVQFADVGESIDWPSK